MSSVDFKMMKSEHIKREDLLELVEHLNKNERCKNCYLLASCDAWVRNATTLYDDYTYSIENCPYYVSVDNVVEVKHGKWIWKELYGEVGYMLVCSECEESEGACERYDYCPHCGAKMDLKEGKE